MYVGVVIKALLNMHDLNNERAEEIRRVPVVYRTKDGQWKVFEEAVAVSGLMIKRWHFTNMVALGLKEEVNFCEFCRNLEAIRVPSRTKGSEFDFIERCAGEDVHGFLRAEPVLRRESLAKFSWMLPLLNEETVKTFGLPTPFRVVQHTRNIREITKEAAKRMGVDYNELRRWQMPYPRSYATGLYGFVSTLDLEHIGYSFTNNQALSNDERKKRQIIAIQAYVPTITGACGASLARALPVTDVLGVITVLSDKPIPAPVHPLYSEGMKENIDLYRSVSESMDSNIAMYIWTKEEELEVTGKKEGEKFKLVVVNKPADGFTEVIKQLKG